MLSNNNRTINLLPKSVQNGSRRPLSYSYNSQNRRTKFKPMQIRTLRSRSPSIDDPRSRSSSTGQDPQLPTINQQVPSIQQEPKPLQKYLGSRKMNITGDKKLETINSIIHKKAPNLNQFEKEVAEAAALAASEVAKDESIKVVATFEGVNIKKQLIRSKRTENALKFFAEIGKKAQIYLPRILEKLSIYGSAAAATTGIGLPVAVACAIIVASVMRAVNQRLQIRQKLNEHFNKLLFIIKNFAVIQQTLALLKINYTEYNESGPVIDPVTQEPKIATTYTKLSDAFQEAVVAYSTLVEAQGPVVKETNGKFRRFFRKAKHGLEILLSTDRVLERLDSLFAEIERQYFLEIGKFTTLMFYNLDSFEQIKDVIKQSKSYMKLATAELSYKSPSCSKTLKAGEEEDDIICVLPPEVLSEELKKDLISLYSIITPQDLEKSQNILALVSEGTDEITERALNNLNADLANVDKIVKIQVGDIIEAGTSLAEQAISIKTSVNRYKAHKSLSNNNNNNNQAGGKKTIRRRRSNRRTIKNKKMKYF